MASYIYSQPQNTIVSQERVVISTNSATKEKRGGRYLGGTVPPLVNVVPRVRRTKEEQ
jgi:hypothetical protein